MKKAICWLGVIVLFIMIFLSGIKNPLASDAQRSNPKSVKLRIMLPGYGRFRTQFEQYLQQFAKKEQNEKNLKVMYSLELPPDSTLLKTRLATGDPPDIYSLHAAFDAPFFAKAGYLPDLTKEPFVSKLFDGVRKIVTMNGKVWGVPMESFTWSYLYNKAIFQKYGLKPPATLTEMKQVINILKKNNVTPFMLPYKDAYFAGWLAQLSFCAITAYQIPDWWDRMNAGKASFNEVKKRGMFDIIDLVNANGQKKPSPLEVSAEDGVARFAKGEAAMLVTGPWYADSILKVNPNFKLGLAALPVNDNPKNTMVMIAVSMAITHYPKTPNVAVVRNLLNYLLDDKDSSAFFIALKFNPVSKTQKIPLFPWTADGLEYVKKGLVYPDRAIPPLPNETLGKMAQLYFLRQVTQQKFINELDNAWKKSLQNNK